VTDLGLASVDDASIKKMIVTGNENYELHKEKLEQMIEDIVREKFCKTCV